MRYLLYRESVDGLLQPVEEARRPDAPLGVVELERDGQCRFEEPSAVFAPSQERIGEQFGIDTRHTVNLAFRQRRSVTGQSVSSFIDRHTVPILKKYLNDERLSLTQIADRMNFTSLSYFSRYCSKHLGQSPSEYRRSLQPRG